VYLLKGEGGTSRWEEGVKTRGVNGKFETNLRFTIENGVSLFEKAGVGIVQREERGKTAKLKALW